MKALLLNIGDEVVSGKVINTNASYISLKLDSIGIDVSRIISIRDIESEITSIVSSFMKSDDKILITTGGLGPTHDDITKEVISSILGLKLELRQEATRPWYNYSNSVKIDCNVKQGYFPECSLVIKNDLGTADGVYLEYENKIIIMLVGPPLENQPMLEKVMDKLSIYGDNYQTIDFILMGKTEAEFENMVSPLFNDEVSISPYADNGKVRFRIRSNTSIDQFNYTVTKFRELFKEFIISENSEDINEVLVKYLKSNSISISFAESMTGGLLAKLITDISGASEIINSSFVTYSNEAKTQILKVSNQTIDQFGVVSNEVTKEMVDGLEILSKADINIAISGYAGPTGEVGKTSYTIKYKSNYYHNQLFFKGTREVIRIRAARQVFYHTLRIIRDLEE